MNTTLCVKKQKKKKDLALREGLQPLVKLLSQVPKINSIFHQLRSSRAQSLAFKKFGCQRTMCRGHQKRHNSMNPFFFFFWTRRVWFLKWMSLFHILMAICFQLSIMYFRFNPNKLNSRLCGSIKSLMPFFNQSLAVEKFGVFRGVFRLVIRDF
jgi:hypothetical protein